MKVYEGKKKILFFSSEKLAKVVIIIPYKPDLFPTELKFGIFVVVKKSALSC
jgi:hypothetical protein